MNTHASRLRAALRAVLALSVAAAEVSACDSSSSHEGAASVDACAPVRLGEVLVPDAGPDCGNIQLALPCGLPTRVGLQGCAPSVDLCNVICPTNALLSPCVYDETSCLADGSFVSDVPLIVDCPTCLGNLGRRPRELAPYDGAKSGSQLGDWLASAAFLEAASVRAFRDLARSLASLGAPRSLVRACARAEADERLHARSARRLAKRFGAVAPRPRANGRGVPELEALLVENMVEGCVRETYGALIAMHQAERARDAEIARHARTLAVDEARHAALAWRVHAWGMARLDARARVRVLDARERAIASLREEARVAHAPAVVEAAGIPSARAARALVDRFARDVARESPRVSRRDARSATLFQTH